MSTSLTSPASSPGDDGLAHFVAIVQANLTGASFITAFDAIAILLCKEHDRYFIEQADPNGEPWKPLHNKTADSRFLRDLGGGGIGSGRQGKLKEAGARAAGLKPDHTILIDTGSMKSSVVVRTHGDHVEQISDHELEWGTRDPKAADHQYGAESTTYDERAERWVKIVIPPRPFVGWSEQAIGLAVDLVADEAVHIMLAGL